MQVASEDRAAFADLVDAPRPDRLRAAHRAADHGAGDPRAATATRPLAEWRWEELFDAWWSVTHAMQKLRDNPECADEERDARVDFDAPGLRRSSAFDPAEDIAAPYIATGARPNVAILREQGVNSQVEMAAAFDRAGFDAFDVHMSDLIAGRATLDDFAGFVACGGFSYGDVLGAGRGWATSILERTDAARRVRRVLRARRHASRSACATAARCWRSSRPMIPGAEHWPRFLRNRSEQYEARLALLEVLESPSLFLRGMAGSRIPVAVAHGEGRAALRRAGATQAAARVALRYVDGDGSVGDRVSGQPERLARCASPA